MGHSGHGEDLAQEALIKTYRAWRRLHPDGDAEAYTRRVMERAAWRAGRRLWRREVPAAVLPDRQTPDLYDSSDVALLVFAALRALPAQQRVVLALPLLGGPVRTGDRRLSWAARRAPSRAVSAGPWPRCATGVAHCV